MGADGEIPIRRDQHPGEHPIFYKKEFPFNAYDLVLWVGSMKC